MAPVTDQSPVDPPVDPVRVKRAEIVRRCQQAQRVGYVLFGLFLLFMAVGLATGLPSWTATAMGICLVGGSIVLLPAILVAYMAKAAEREDRERGI